LFSSTWLVIIALLVEVEVNSSPICGLALALHPLSAGYLTRARRSQRRVADLDRAVALVLADQDAGGRNARTRQLE
jgi:hypothetical protein